MTVGRLASPIRSIRSVLAIEAASSVLCRRWRLGVLWLIASGCRRYSQLVARLPGISPKVLAQQLRGLEQEGLISRHAAPSGRKRVEYALTPLGEMLRPPLEELERWGRAYEQERGLPPDIRDSRLR